ncbi:MAG: D-alanyl-D-alanine carboxypeptidase family protein [Schaedlerella sp.]|nr:D-alanyl-D-alanine carboxypeptidase family protein [Schaedlerella sp.]
MKNRIKNFIALVLSAVILACTFTVPTYAQEGFTYEFEKHCKALYMFDPSDGAVLYSMDAEEILPMASLTKVMTYIVASENIPDIENTVITVADRIEEDLEGTDSSVAGVRAGEELTVLQLLNMMMIPSGNDASLALHIYYDENIAGVEFTGETRDTPFVNLMNEKAEELGCVNTHFVNPHGLHDEEHYSTAKDFAKIVQYALTLPHFKEITSALEYKIPPTNKCEEERIIKATNRMLLENADEGKYYYEYADGIKTGSHDEAGYCIAASATKGEQSYIVIALGSPMVEEESAEEKQSEEEVAEEEKEEEKKRISEHGEMLDAKALFEWGFNEISQRVLCNAEDVVGEIPLLYAWKKEVLNLIPNQEVSVLLPNNVTEKQIELKIETAESVKTPVTKGDVLGKAVYSYEGAVLAEVNLVASESVERSYPAQAIAVLKDMFPVVWPLLLAVIAFLIGFIVLIREFVKKVSKKKKEKFVEELQSFGKKFDGEVMEIEEFDDESEDEESEDEFDEETEDDELDNESDEETEDDEMCEESDEKPEEDE